MAASPVVDSATFVIDGSRDAALFMPWELMERLLNASDASSAGSDSLRESYTDDVVAAGWSTMLFWSEFDAIGRDYLATRRELTLHDQSRSGLHGGVAEPAGEGVRRRYCSARADALRRAREKFGNEQFDRFLYTAVAPRVVVFADEPMTAEQLRTIAEGCR